MPSTQPNDEQARREPERPGPTLSFYCEAVKALVAIHGDRSLDAATINEIGHHLRHAEACFVRMQQPSNG